MDTAIITGEDKKKLTDEMRLFIAINFNNVTRNRLIDLCEQNWGDWKD